MKTLLLLLTVLTIGCGPSVLPDTDPQIMTLRALHHQFLAETNPRHPALRIHLQLEARDGSAGIEERRLPPDLRDWIHDLRKFGAAL